jgi:hypothetical protein
MESYRQFRGFGRRAQTLCPQGASANKQGCIEEKVSEENFIVEFDGPSDPANPRNWSLLKRILVTASLGNIALLVGIAGAIDSAVLPQAAHDYGVGEVPESLATGLVIIFLPIREL